MTEIMRALVAGRGPEWVLAETPIPQPGPGQVLIRNRASATNNADLPMLAEADPTSGGTGKAFIAGFEYAGEIAGLGDDVGDWQVGDAVMGTFPSAFGEYLVADHRFVLPRPDGLNPEVACALPTALLTEYGALTVAEFESGQSVLVTGASTGIGMIGVQIAKAVGASQVIATTRSEDKREMLTGLGAEAALTATGGGRLAGPASTIDLDALSYRHLTVRRVSFGFSRDWETVPILERLRAEVLPAVGRGVIRPVIDRTVDVADVRVGATGTHPWVSSGCRNGSTARHRRFVQTVCSTESAVGSAAGLDRLRLVVNPCRPLSPRKKASQSRRECQSGFSSSGQTSDKPRITANRTGSSSAPSGNIASACLTL